jgi:YidC/Oxa1 family membrane protein insertase
MPNLRSFLLLALAFTAFLLWQAWQQDYAARDGAPAVAASDTPAPPNAEPTPGGEIPAPAPAAAPASDAAADAPASDAGGTRITVETDVLRVEIDTRGGTVTQADLLRYPVDAAKPQPVVRLLDDEAAPIWFVAQSGLVSADGPAPDHRALYRARPDAGAPTLGDAESLEVPLTWRGDNGLVVTKTLVFTRGSYVIDVRHTLDNEGSAPLAVSAYRQLQRSAPPTSSQFSFTNPEAYSFVGAAWYSPEERFEKLAFDDFADEPLKREIKGGWAAMQQHYFFAAWIPPAAETAHYATEVIGSAQGPRYLIREVAPAQTVAPGTSLSLDARLYVGPKLQNELPKIAPGLEYTVDYGKVTIIAQPLFWLLSWLHKLVGNWGWAIVLITLLVKLALYPLSEAQYRSMAKMRKLQPRLAALKERYGDDRQKLGQAQMELYQKEKINPMGGCLPLVVQIPVFIALYWVLLESVELRQAPFVGWIQNLSDKDPYFVLPVLNGLTMIAAQRLSPAVGMDPTQQKIIQAMPIVFAVMFAFFPAGLVLYWTVNGLLGLLQQWVIMRRHEGTAKA